MVTYYDDGTIQRDLLTFDRFKKSTGNNEIYKLVAFDKSNKDFRNSFKENQDIGVIDLLSMVIEED